MTELQRQVMLQMIEGFLNDPPDTEYQRGFLAALLTISNEIMGIPTTDPVWKHGDELITAFPMPPSQRMLETAQREKAKKKLGLVVIKGDKT